MDLKKLKEQCAEHQKTLTPPEGGTKSWCIIAELLAEIAKLKYRVAEIAHVARKTLEE